MELTVYSSRENLGYSRTVADAIINLADAIINLALFTERKVMFSLSERSTYRWE